MATRGRKPKPAAQRRREGNPGHRKIKESWDARGAPPPPDDLGPIALEFWNTVIADLGAIGVLDPSDAPVLETWARAYERFKLAQREIDEDGLAAYGSTGQPTEHPMLPVLERASNTVLRIASEFGATAAARARIDLTKHGDEEAGDMFERELGPSARHLRAV